MNTGGVPTATGAEARLAAARQIADSVLYEGYVLFPYRASARKNRYRWQFGVVVPAGQAVLGATEPSSIRCECLLEGPDARVTVMTRFLHLRRRDVQEQTGAAEEHRSVDQLDVGGRLLLAWDEGVEREVTTGELDVRRLLDGEHTTAFHFTGETGEEEVCDDGGRPFGRVVRTLEPLAGVVTVRALRRSSGVVLLRVSVENGTPWRDARASRGDVLRRSLVGAHLILLTSGGSFLSLLDPPDHARQDAAACTNVHTYPVLVGTSESHDVVLSSPIILYDHPEIAPESPGDSFDATEIDELLALSVQSLTDEEKREARATDARSAQVVDRAEHLPPELRERLHAAARAVAPATAAAEDPFGELFGVGEQPREAVVAGPHTLRVGGTVRLRPQRRADAQDVFAAGRRARIRRIVEDIDGDTWIGVTFDDDPGAELHDWHGRFLYFSPDEVEPLSAGVPELDEHARKDG